MSHGVTHRPGYVELYEHKLTSLILVRWCWVSYFLWVVAYCLLVQKV